jgi:TetR/AcrR family transcriptional regulator, lmrAB and yxaGH operons repressor
MSEKGGQREKIVRATADLLRRRGYAATGLADIIAASGAPKGSLYHYFPGGKDQIAAAAVKYAGALVSATIGDLAATGASAADVVRAYGALLAEWMAQSGFEDGCPITTTLLETAPANGEIAEAGRAAFADWARSFAARLVDAGVAEERAARLGRLAIMTLEGALVLARAENSNAPIELATDEISALFERESRP